MKKALKVLMCMMMVISLFTIASASVMAKESSMIFVDGKNGNDNNPGTLNKPVQTLAKAQELARAKTNNMDEDLKVYLREGTYVLDETLVFDSRDSGQNGYNVVWSISISFSDFPLLLTSILECLLHVDSILLHGLC